MFFKFFLSSGVESSSSSSFLFFSLDFFSLKKPNELLFFRSLLQSNQSLSLFPFPLLTIMYILRRTKQRSASRKPHELYLFQTRKGAIRMREATTANAKCRFDAFLRTKRFARTISNWSIVPTKNRIPTSFLLVEIRRQISRTLKPPRAVTRLFGERAPPTGENRARRNARNATRRGRRREDLRAWWWWWWWCRWRQFARQNYS